MQNPTTQPAPVPLCYRNTVCSITLNLQPCLHAAAHVGPSSALLALTPLNSSSGWSATPPSHSLTSSQQTSSSSTASSSPSTSSTSTTLTRRMNRLYSLKNEEEAEDATSELGPQLTTTPSTTEPPSMSKRWTDIFRRSKKKSSILTGGMTEDKSKDKQRRREKRVVLGNSTELNINLWPFLRSTSEGNGAVRPRLSSGGPTTRSRSNSGGDPKSRKWPGSPARPGLHLGRTSPVWQVKHSPRASIDSGEPRRINKVPMEGSSRKASVLNLNVPMCSGYRHHLGCRTDENVRIGRVTGIGNGAGGGGGHGLTSCSGGSTTGNMFNLRSLFIKKVH